MKTEYDYLVEKRRIFVKEALAKAGIAMVNGELKLCKDVYCGECDFNKNNVEHCNIAVMKRLNEEHISEIKCCPHCGNKNIKLLNNIKNLDPDYYCICDFNKGGCGASGGHRATKEEAIKAWNRRV